MSRFKRLLRIGGIAAITGIVVGGIALIYAWSTLELPPDQPLTQTTFVTDADGAPLARFNAGENRTPIVLNDVPVVMRDAVIATEDRSFYDHSGVDPRGIARALWVDIREGSAAQGGSTLSQQYVKQTYVGTDQTLIRKFKEAVLAVKLEQKYSKDEILERYLNTVYFGRGAYGVQAASVAYFAKDATQLELREASYLAGLLKAPELADVTSQPAQAKSRRDTTLNSMMLTGFITDEQRLEAENSDLGSYVVGRSQLEGSISSPEKGTQYFVDYVKKILIQRYGEERVMGGGLQIKTTIDLDMQARAYDAIYKTLDAKDPAGALVTVDDTGAVKAMVGGRDWSVSKVNLAVGRDGGGSGRQAGSTFKPFTLAAAVEDDTCYRETYDAPARIVLQDGNKEWIVNNFANENKGRQNLLGATASSTNTVYAQLNEEIGPAKTAALAKKAGITSPVESNLGNVLGTASVSPLELAGAYMTFGQNGLQVAPNPIAEVKTPDGEVLERLRPSRTRAMAEETAETVNLALREVVSRGGSGASAILDRGRAVAGKTGTTENNADAWFVGYTPTLSTAVWMGYPDSSTTSMRNVNGFSQVTGGTLPASIWKTYMNQVVPNDSEDFTEPPSCRANDDSEIFGGTTSTIPTDQDNDFRLRLPDELRDLGNNGRRADRVNPIRRNGGENANSTNSDDGDGTDDMQQLIELPDFEGRSADE